MTVVHFNGRTFDWRPKFDPRSRAYGVGAVAAERQMALLPPQKRFWTGGPLLDQGPDGACVGFAWAAELAASPTRVVGITNHFAHAYYRRCQRNDEWPGEAYEGTSVHAGAKLAVELGFCEQYRWGFSPRDVIDAVVNFGPVVEGTVWLDGMFDTRPSGLLEIDGRSGDMGHAYLIRGYHPNIRLHGEGWFKRHEVFICRMSWGPFGLRSSGDFYLKVEDWANKLFPGGEHCVPIARMRPDIGTVPLAASALLRPQPPRTV